MYKSVNLLHYLCQKFPKLINKILYFYYSIKEEFHKKEEFSKFQFNRKKN